MNVDDRTIRDFGGQWSRYPDNKGYYGSIESLGHKLGPLLQLSQLEGKRVADIGSGTGRIVNMLLEAGAVEIFAVEPSDSIETLRNNTCQGSERIHYIHGRGEDLPGGLELDYVFCIGVLHNIFDPFEAVLAAFTALKNGGQFVAWVYGSEGQELYVRLVRAIRMITTVLPDSLLAAICRVLVLLVDAYTWACRYISLPLGNYLVEYLSKCTREVRIQTIYDQLNPATSEYYSEERIRRLLEAAGFSEVRTYHFQGYSWSVIGTKA